eukprot:05711.XXX_299286_299471_1 [CDS] Oithona nana genome sequencing.
MMFYPFLKSVPLIYYSPLRNQCLLLNSSRLFLSKLSSKVQFALLNKHKIFIPPTVIFCSIF